MGRPRKNAVQTKDTTTTTPKTKAKEPEEETENLTLTLTRSRRTPKPNPKYQNDVILPYSSRIVTGDSSRSTTPAKSETSEEVVPQSDEDEEDLVKSTSGKKRGRPPKKPLQATPSVVPEPAKKVTPQPKGTEKKDNTPRRLPERSVKQQTPPEAPVQKRKREEEINEVSKKKVKGMEEKTRTPPLTKIQQQQQPVRALEKKPVPVGKNPSPNKGDIVDVAGTRENVKIVDVSEILKKKHEVVVDEPNKRMRKCPPETSSRPPPLYSSKILSQPQKVSPSNKPQQTVTPTIRPKISPKAPPKFSPTGARQLNSNGKFNINNVAKHFVSVAPPKCPVIDLTRSGETVERPKKTLKNALTTSTIRKTIQRPTVPAPLRSLSSQKPTILSSVKVPVMKKKSITPLSPAKVPQKQPVAVRQKQRETVMTIEKWNVVQLPVEKFPDVAPKVSLGMTLKELEDQIKDIQLPTDAWNHNVPEDYTEPPTTIAFKRTVPGAEVDADKGTAKVDRSVTFKDMEIIIEIDGSEVTLVGAPDTLTTVLDVQTLLQIVNDLTLKNSCVEEVTVVL